MYINLELGEKNDGNGIWREILWKWNLERISMNLEVIAMILELGENFYENRIWRDFL